MDKNDRPLICHVEVGGTLGGSFLALEKYLRHCDSDRFRHEVVFYQRPSAVGPTAGNRWLTFSLELPVPMAASAGSGARPSLSGRLRGALREFPLAVNLASIPRAVRQAKRQQPQVATLATFLRERNCALVHVNNHFSYQIPTLYAAEQERIPAVSHYRTIGPIISADRWLSRKVACIVPQNEACAAHLERFSFHAPVRFVGDVVEEPPAIAPGTVTELRRQLLRGRGTVLVGTVTRLEEARKGIPELLRAIARVEKSFPEARFAIVGDGHDAPQYKQSVAEMGLAERVVFAGHQSNPYPYYKAFDIFVCPALVEGGPYTVLEAMQSGCAIVSTRVGQVPMWVEHGRNGLMVEPGDSAALAAGMEQLLRDEAGRKAMGENAARSIREKLLTPQQGAANLDDLFAETLQSYHRRPRKKR